MIPAAHPIIHPQHAGSNDWHRTVSYVLHGPKPDNMALLAHLKYMQSKNKDDAVIDILHSDHRAVGSTSLNLNERSPLVGDSDVVGGVDSHRTPRRPCSPATRYDDAVDSEVDKRSLPIVMGITLGLLGMWFPRSRDASLDMKWTPCGERSMGDCGDDIDLEDLSRDILEVDRDFDENDHESDWPRRRCRQTKRGGLRADVIGFIYLGSICVMMIYDFTNYMMFFWGNQKQLLHLVTYFTYLWAVMVIPIWCLYARVCYHATQSKRRRTYPLYRECVERRVALLCDPCFGARGLSWFYLVCFLAWPLLSASLRMFDHFFFPNCGTLSNAFTLCSLTNAVLGFSLYGCFCYLIFIHRRSFECEVELLTRFAKEQARKKRVDAVRDKIRLFYTQYAVLRKQIGIWMAFNMVVATWGLTSHLTWNYLLFTHDGSQGNIPPQFRPKVYFLNALVTSQKIMFCFVPCVALGGLNLDHVWLRFRSNIALLRQHKHEEYWSALLCFIRELSTVCSGGLSATLIYSAIGLYIGLNLGQSGQDFTFWGYPDCNYNQTNENITFF